MFGGVGRDGRGQNLRTGQLRRPAGRVSSIGFIAPSAATNSAAIADAVHLADTWLDGATSLPAGATKAVSWATNWVDNTLATWKRLQCDPMARASPRSGRRRCRKGQAWPARCVVMSQMGGQRLVRNFLRPALGRLSVVAASTITAGRPKGVPNTPSAVESFAAGLEQPRSEF